MPPTPLPVDRVLGLGLVGAGRFATFIAAATASIPEVALRGVADPRLDDAQRLATSYGAWAAIQADDLLIDPEIDIVVVATPPDSHTEIVTAALEAGKHVFCEKPLALDPDDARALAGTVERTGQALVVDHVLRYNPILRALTRLQDRSWGALLGRLQRFCLENDASDQDLDGDHWFWDQAQSGGIFVEHGVHFFDAATMLFGTPATSVQAMAAHRPHGPVDLVSATLAHGDDALATHTHSFTHAHRCERQLMRLDFGPAEVLVEGWIPVRAAIDVWTDDEGIRTAERLPARMTELLYVDGFRLGAGAYVTVDTTRQAETPRARGRGIPLDVPHRVRVELSLGGHEAKAEAYAESVRACMTDLVGAVTHGLQPFSSVHVAAAAVTVAATAQRSSEEGRTLPVLDNDTQVVRTTAGYNQSRF